MCPRVGPSASRQVTAADGDGDGRLHGGPAPAARTSRTHHPAPGCRTRRGGLLACPFGMEPSGLQASMRLPASKKECAFCRSPASQMMAECCCCECCCCSSSLWKARPLPLLSACWLATGSGLASAPRWGEAVVEHEHALHVEALGHVRHELVRGGREGAVAVEELPAIRPRLSRARQWARVRWACTPAGPAPGDPGLCATMPSQCGTEHRLGP